MLRGSFFPRRPIISGPVVESSPLLPVALPPLRLPIVPVIILTAVPSISTVVSIIVPALGLLTILAVVYPISASALMPSLVPVVIQPALALIRVPVSPVLLTDSLVVISSVVSPAVSVISYSSPVAKAGRFL